VVFVVEVVSGCGVVTWGWAVVTLGCEAGTMESVAVIWTQGVVIAEKRSVHEVERLLGETENWKEENFVKLNEVKTVNEWMEGGDNLMELFDVVGLYSGDWKDYVRGINFGQLYA